MAVTVFFLVASLLVLLGLCVSRRKATAGAAGPRQRSFSDAVVTGTVPAAVAVDAPSRARNGTDTQQLSPPREDRNAAPRQPSVPERAAPQVDACEPADSDLSRTGQRVLGDADRVNASSGGSPLGIMMRSLRSDLPDSTIWDAYATAVQRIPSPPLMSWQPAASTDPPRAAPVTNSGAPQQAPVRAVSELAGVFRPVDFSNPHGPSAGTTFHQQPQQEPQRLAAAAAAGAITPCSILPLWIPTLLSIPGTNAAGEPERCLQRESISPAELPDTSAVYLRRMHEEELQDQRLMRMESKLKKGGSADLGPCEPDPTSPAGLVSVSVPARSGGGGGSADQQQPAEVRRPPLVGANVSSIELPPGLRAGISDQADAAALGVEEAHMNINVAELAIDHEIGRGGFGCVYSGTYRGRPVAIKMLLGANTVGSELSALRLEVSILSRAKHPNIVRIYGCNLSGPQPFIVEELLMCTLQDYIYHPMADTRILLMVMLARDIAAALEYLHPSVLHRDLKPSNVLLSKAGNPKLADFGLARWKLRTLLSTKSVEAGSVPYLAPECFDPNNWRLSDRIDIYSLGIIINEMLMRSPPWAGLSTMEVATEVLVQGRRPAMPPPGGPVPAALLRLVKSCLAQKPADRPSAAAVHRELVQLYEEIKAG